MWFRRGDAPENRAGEVVAGRVIEMIGEVGERGFEIDHNATSSPSAVRNWFNARESRDFTVPIGHESASAVSLSLKPAK